MLLARLLLALPFSLVQLRIRGHPGKGHVTDAIETQERRVQLVKHLLGDELVGAEVSPPRILQVRDLLLLRLEGYGL